MRRGAVAAAVMALLLSGCGVMGAGSSSVGSRPKMTMSRISSARSAASWPNVRSEFWSTDKPLKD